MGKLLKLGKIALAVPPEAVVVAHDKVLHAQVTDQIPTHEFQRRGIRKLRGKGMLDQGVQARGRQQFGALFGQG